ncbi:trypsin-like serine protease [Ascoidea rubescens DSM 1968]|uniref:Pro-apoptotic serine protease NMA111 n=1 Tax=Ascoidea rubescens DSM 1968 TaxID=1344418 RepID=A0A1D2VS57_9ASCO|nr:trypsin-like serine protease [Ascoidea rubescens DSM 1968]ODV64407.1 trypsin-like serine protease [Ascoidea rubescens DSM 1968]
MKTSMEIENLSKDIYSSLALGGSDQSNRWQKTVETVIKSIVSIHFCQIVSFDSDFRSSSQATGFIIDKENGIILTNRHVVSPGPFTGYIILDNYEEVPVIPIYRDPIHDFGFLKFNPNDVKHMKLPPDLKLRPDLVKVGVEIRVIGNDNGEKLSILSGFISRTNRNAPYYGCCNYNDFNIEYIQAAANAKGGSSGSPVIDINGNVLAMEAGGSFFGATDFFLPIDRVFRALHCIQKNKPILRGTIQVTWNLKPFDECKRLGLTSEIESKMRSLFPETIGLLVAEIVLPKGPADNLIREGDVLIAIHNKEISCFKTIDEILDSSVGQSIKFTVQRDGKILDLACKVQDLHSITPDRYIKFCDSIFHNLSYQLARTHNLAVSGVFVSQANGPFEDADLGFGYIIKSIDNKTVNNLDEFINVLKHISDKSMISITCMKIENIHNIETRTVYIDKQWYEDFRLAIRNDETGLWDFNDLGFIAPSKPLKPLNAKFIEIHSEKEALRTLPNSFVTVTAHHPLNIDGAESTNDLGSGLVIDAKKGLVLVSRYYIENDLGYFRLTFADSVIIPAKVVFFHPLYGFVILKYDPSLILAPVQEIKFIENPLKKGDELTFVYQDNTGKFSSSKTKVGSKGLLKIELEYSYPCYRATNCEIVSISTKLSSSILGGILVDDDANVRGLCLKFTGVDAVDNSENYLYSVLRCIDICHVSEIVKSFKISDLIPSVRIIDAEFSELPISTARVLGVKEEWIEKLENSALDEENHRLKFINVSSVACSKFEEKSLDKNSLKVSDVILTVNGNFVNKVTDITSLMFKNDELELRVVRNQKEILLKIGTFEVEKTEETIHWCGANFQNPFYALRQSLKELPSDVYVMTVGRGSPAKDYGLGSSHFITHVNEIETPTLDKFLSAIKQVADNSYVKVRAVSLSNQKKAITLKTNYHYFPTNGFKKNADGEWEYFS